MGEMEKIASSLCAETQDESLIEHWSSFVSHICNGRKSFFDAVHNEVLYNENIWSLAVESGAANETLNTLAALDIAKLLEIAEINIKKLASDIAEHLFKNDLKSLGENVIIEGNLLSVLPSENLKNFSIDYFSAFIKERGAGVFAKGNMFSYSQDKEFIPASHADKICIRDLNRYDDVRQIVIYNTQHFLCGNGNANNMLLYGERGCGKSATVKAICNDFAPKGLRLIEVKKNQIFCLNEIVQKIKNRNLKFILFIDDLSFESGTDDFNSLKAYLDGGIEQKPHNIIVYATSNRRHLVKESASNNSTSNTDVRAFDTVQEQLSLADRFGVTVIFSAPSQEEYLSIAVFLAKSKGVLAHGASEDVLALFKSNALLWEKWFNGRSPRTAAQFVEWAGGGGAFPWE
ncbi:MAG: ATP-binding protein [Termitinemataceae bacterium]|nr:MAG: ATP-binding protein [Termitinemataceae bacterium]